MDSAARSQFHPGFVVEYIKIDTLILLTLPLLSQCQYTGKQEQTSTLLLQNYSLNRLIMLQNDSNYKKNRKILLNLKHNKKGTLRCDSAHRLD